MKTYLYILELTDAYKIESQWTEQTNATVSAHFNYLKQLHEQGIVLIVGKTDYDIAHPHNKGYVIFNAETETEALQIMNNDPAVQQQIMQASLHPFKLALMKT